ncbi:MAG: helix-turn-helix domain-containing protein, partial [Victivallaceae bacterium]|nr:helix-turn-helix domain-containing protein [Victivallaceae bacterium]
MRHADVIVASDDQRIGTMAADYFLRRGYRNYVCAAVNVRGRADRTRVQRAGSSVETLPLRFDGALKEENRELADLLLRCTRPFCVFCDNDFDAATVVDAAVNAGLNVPRDLAVLGVGNESFFSNPGALELSSVDSRLYERAFFAAQCMDMLLDGKLPRRESEGQEAILHHFAPKIIMERASTDFYAIEEPRLRKMVQFLQENAASSHFRVALLAKKFLLTESSIYRTFRAAFGISPKQFLLEERLRMAQRKLGDTSDTLLSIAEECGFPGPGALHYSFKRKFGCPPNEWRESMLARWK